MAEFKNEFSWSASRDNLFKECKRKYYFNYYGYWNAWKDNADEKTKKIYMLKKMTNRTMLAGNTVHEVIELIITNHSLGATFTFEKANTFMIEKLQKAYIESKNKKWKTKVKGHCNLQEHYFNYNISQNKWIEFRDNASTCLKGFYDSDENETIKNSSSDSWLAIENLDSFQYYDTKIYAAPDFAFTDNDKIIIYDWKTGQPSQKDETQLAIYALYAHHKWGAEYSKMELSDVYLKIGACVYAKDLEEKISETKNYIKASIDEMKGLLVNVEDNTAVESDFPMTNDSNKCKWCNFREICHPNNWEEL